ncbi:chemotaxis protein CheW [Colwellia echini]|uniref:Chemotaxis protein CheW n=2 Tax=Colwellia echini TaxID=1982103 RepID=A0ABY3MWW7_9GAMM|nr:chemotaxis protein CheW [Colwellia echini]
MKTYLSELLTDPDLELAQQRDVKPKFNKPLAHKENKSLEKLLKTVSEPKQLTPLKSDASIAALEVKVEVTERRQELSHKVKNDLDATILTKLENLPSQVNDSIDELSKLKEKSYRQGDFQAMYFDVAGLIIAVPLIELGGIHKADKTTSLMGKPDWFKGVMLHRDEKINVVDTALWVMPEKCDETLKSSLNYQYIIMLNDSNWGLLAENLVDTVVLSQDQVKWLDTSSKRPWLAGLVKEKMCALLDVSALIELLDKGSDIYTSVT